MQGPDPKMIHLNDQALEMWKNTIPPMLFSMYSGFLAAGFNEYQALDLTKQMLLQFSLYTRPTDRKDDE